MPLAELIPKTCGWETTRMDSLLKLPSTCYYWNFRRHSKNNCYYMMAKYRALVTLSPWHLAACIEIWIVLRRLQIHQPSWYWLQGEQVLRAQPMIRFTLKCIYIGNQFQRRGPANEIALLPASAKLYPQEASGSFPDEHRLPGGMEMVLRLLWKVSGNH